MIIALVDHDWRRQFFYLDSAAEVHICLMHTTKKIHHPDHTKLKVLGKGIVTLDVLVDGKPEVVNFCNVTHTLELDYNLLSVGTIAEGRLI